MSMVYRNELIKTWGGDQLTLYELHTRDLQSSKKKYDSTLDELAGAMSGAHGGWPWRLD